MATYNTFRTLFDSMRIVSRINPTYDINRTPQYQIDTFTDKATVMPVVDDLIASGVSVILGIETLRDQIGNKELFYNNIFVDFATGVISYPSDPTLFDGMLEDVATTFSTRNPEAYMLELYAGEPKAAFTDLNPTYLARAFHPNIGVENMNNQALLTQYATELAEFSARIQSANAPWGFTKQRTIAATVLQPLQEHMVDVIRAISPDSRIIWAGTNTGAITGPPGYQGINPSTRSNCLLGFHQYGPHTFSHNGQPNRNGGIEYDFIWPDPLATWEALVLAGYPSANMQDLRFEMYNGTINLPWTNESLTSLYAQAKAYCDSLGVEGIVTEYGCYATCRDNPAAQIYIAASLDAIHAAGLKCCGEWRDTIAI